MKNLRFFSAFLVLICAHQAFGGDVSPKRPEDLQPTKWDPSTPQKSKWVTVELTHGSLATFQEVQYGRKYPNGFLTSAEITIDVYLSSAKGKFHAPDLVEHKETRYNKNNNTYTTLLDINTQRCRMADHGTHAPFIWSVFCDNDKGYEAYTIAQIICYIASRS